MADSIRGNTGRRDWHSAARPRAARIVFITRVTGTGRLACCGMGVHVVVIDQVGGCATTFRLAFIGRLGCCAKSIHDPVKISTLSPSQMLQTEMHTCRVSDDVVQIAEKKHKLTLIEHNGHI